MGQFFDSYGIWLVLGLFIFMMMRRGGGCCGGGHGNHNSGSSHDGHHNSNHPNHDSGAGYDGHGHNPTGSLEGEAMQNEIILDVEGMTCGHCKASVENAVSALEGVGRVEADLDSQQVCVVYDPAKVKVEDIKQAITAQGYHVA